MDGTHTGVAGVMVEGKMGSDCTLMIINGIDEISKRYWLIGSGDKTVIGLMTGETSYPRRSCGGQEVGVRGSYG
jgi:hypothetical protein